MSVIAEPSAEPAVSDTASNKPAETRVNCNLCGDDNVEVLFAAGVAQISRVVRCRACGLMYANPRARGADCEDIENWDPDWNLIQQNEQRRQKEELQVRDYEDTRAQLNGLYPQRGTLLEVGGGLGYLLSQFRDDGWTVKSVEPWAEACQFANREFGIDAVAATLEQAAIADDYADVVVMLHVIEHVPDPLGTLQEIYRVLKPGGRLVLETPRYDTLWFKLLGKRERSLNCDGHIYFFTTESLQAMTEKTGFELIENRSVGRHLSLDRFVWNIGTISKSDAILNKLMALSHRMRLDKRSVHVNIRDMQRLLLRKPG